MVGPPLDLDPLRVEHLAGAAGAGVLRRGENQCFFIFYFLNLCNKSENLNIGKEDISLHHCARSIYEILHFR